MQKSLLASVVAGAVLLSTAAQAEEQTAPQGYQLQQVLIMSRHNLRAPLANNGSVLELGWTPLRLADCFGGANQSFAWQNKGSMFDKLNLKSLIW